MNNESTGGFDQLLEWLDPERERAGKAYEEIRRKLIRFFIRRGCSEPDILADVTIDRVSNLVLRDGFQFTGERIVFFYGVARNVFREWTRRTARPLPRASEYYTQPKETLFDNCLKNCLGRLTLSQRHLVLCYYRYETGKKTECHETLAKEHGISLGLLRLRVHRIRLILRECIEKCVQLGEGIE